ncbi:MAG: hypothetical protein RLZZ373_2087 [Pseudomonadota bacterium]|jgi:hypothetical protein
MDAARVGVYAGACAAMLTSVQGFTGQFRGKLCVTLQRNINADNDLRATQALS